MRRPKLVLCVGCIALLVTAGASAAQSAAPLGDLNACVHKIMTAWMPGENPNRCVTTACPRASSAGRRPAQPAIEGTFSRAALSGAPAAA